MRNKHSGVRDVGSFLSSPGSRIHKRFESRFDGTSLKLVEAGQEDIQERIEAFAPFTDLNYMLSRLKVGDNSVLCCKQPIYGDLSGMPSNPIDAINTVRLAEQRFLSLPLEQRKAYNNDYHVWLAAVLSGNVVQGSSDISNQSAAPDAKPDVKEDSTDESKR